MSSAISENLLKWETPPNKNWAVECNCRFYLRFHDKELAVNFCKGYAYAMRQRDFERPWKQYDLRHPGFKRGADFATKMRLWARRWGLTERWAPSLYLIENKEYKKVAVF